MRLLKSSHEEADTRMVLHAIHSTCDKIVVYARDTDVFLLLLHHFTKINCKELWLMAGTAKKRKFFPVHKVFQLLEPEIIQSILAFHASTGCDTTSYIAGHTKHSAWKVLQHHSELLKDLGNVPLTDSIMDSVETFFCGIYNVKRCDSIDEARR